MKFFQKTWVAVLVTLLVVLLSTAVNINVNLRRRAEAAEALWSEKNGVAEQLSTRAGNASQLWTVTRNYAALSEQSNGLRSAYNELYGALEDGDITAAYEANTALASWAYAALASLQSQSGVSDRDLENAAYYYNQMENAQRVLEQSGYNDAVADYRALTDAFPLSALRWLIRVKTPAYFA